MMSNLNPPTILAIIIGYFLMLLIISFITGKDNKNSSFFLANRNSPWYLVAIGMIGASLSGVTFISIPGAIGKSGVNTNYSYMQVVIGYLIGYLIIANVLLPIYYRHKLTSIYGYLEKRLGWEAYKTGSAFFILSRVIGASFRLFLVAIVFQVMLMDAWGVPFYVTVLITIGLIWTYTFRGGIQTIVITDTLQTVFMLTAVVITIYFICQAMDLSFDTIWPTIKSADLGQVFYFKNGWSDPNNFFKQVLSGALITIVMTGLDQDMMQKNLTCRSLPDAKKNMYTFSVILIFANLLFVTLGALLYIYAADLSLAIPERGDQLFPMLAMNHLPSIVGIFFLIGLLAAAYSSADSALTALTTAFCIDFLNFEKRTSDDSKQLRRERVLVHIMFSLVLVLVIIVFNQYSSGSVINDLFKAAGYTYGPILALFCFAMWFKNRSIYAGAVISISIAAALLSYILNLNSANWFNGLEFGFLILLVNATLAFLGFLICSRPKRSYENN